MWCRKLCAQWPVRLLIRKMQSDEDVALNAVGDLPSPKPSSQLGTSALALMPIQEFSLLERAMAGPNAGKDCAPSRRPTHKSDDAIKYFCCLGSPSSFQGINVIDSALFVVCLDHSSPDTADGIASNCLHGCSIVDQHVQRGTCINRWFDKSLQIIVCRNGMAGKGVRAYVYRPLLSLDNTTHHRCCIKRVTIAIRHQLRTLLHRRPHCTAVCLRYLHGNNPALRRAHPRRLHCAHIRRA
jgi:hypothetical protein